MNIKKIIVSLLFLIISFSTILNFSLTNNTIVNAAQTHRRIYVFTKSNWDNGVNYGWNDDGEVYIHYWGGAVGTVYASAPKLTEAVNDYNNGLYFIDIPIDVTSFLLKNSAGGNPSIQTSDISISILFEESEGVTNYKVLETWGGGGSYYAQDQLQLNVNRFQIAAVLNNIDTCSTSFAGGFNSFPQLTDLFINPNSNLADFYSTEVTDNFGESTTIQDKIDRIEENFNRGSAT